MSLQPYRALFANRAVALLVVAQWFARLGDQFVSIALLWGALALGEAITFRTLVGAALVIVATWLVLVAPRARGDNATVRTEAVRSDAR